MLSTQKGTAVPTAQDETSEAKHICPWQHAYWFDNIFRRLLHNPRKLYGDYVGPGSVALDVGCGMGFNALGLARLVGPAGRVIAVDLQPEMLDVLAKRAGRAGLGERIETRVCPADSIAVREPVDFAVGFWMVHEVPDAAQLMRELHACVLPGGHVLIAEPRFHVSRSDFQGEIDLAEAAGFTVAARPKVRLSHAAVFQKLT